MIWITIAVMPTSTINESTSTSVAKNFDSKKILFGAGVAHKTGSILTSRSRCIASPV